MSASQKRITRNQVAVSVATILALSTLLLSEIISANTYYVSPSGNDANPGTLSQPWKTIQKCLNTVHPGDTCQVMGGTYSEALVLKTSGTASARITVKTYNSQIVTVNSGASKSLVTTGNMGYYTIDGIRFISTASGTSNTDVSINFSYNFWGDGVFGEKGNDGFILRNCYVEGAIYFYGSDNLVENCEINGMNRKWANAIIERSQPSENNIFRNNTMHDFSQRGAWSLQGTDNSLWEGNTIYNTGLGGMDCDGAGYPVTKCKMVNNIIHDINGEGVGIFLENAFNSLLEGNTIYNVLQGVEIINYGTPIANQEYRNKSINTIIRNNLLYDISGEGIACKGTLGGKLLGNTIKNTKQSRGFWGAITLGKYGDFFCTNWEVKNNKVSQSSLYEVWIDSNTNSLSGLDIDYNNYDKFKARWSNGVSGVDYNFAQWQAKGYDIHSVVGISTPVPPTNTKTNTPVPPTSTKTATNVPPTVTSTKTYTPMPPTSTKTFTPTPTRECIPVTFLDGTIIYVCK